VGYVESLPDIELAFKDFKNGSAFLLSNEFRELKVAELRKLELLILDPQAI
jgi:hypothetical protein